MPTRRRLVSGLIAGAVLAALLPLASASQATAAPPVSAPAASKAGQPSTTTALQPLSTATPRATAQAAPLSSDKPTAAEAARITAALQTELPVKGGGGERARTLGAPPVPPTVKALSVTVGGKGQTGFAGISHLDQRLANGGNQFSIEPPDQALCAGTGLILESVNNAVRVFSDDNFFASDVVDLNSFFGLPAEYDRTADLVGPSLGDPKCYFDPAAERWFLTVYLGDDGDVGLDGVEGTAQFRYYVALAVSRTSDPLGVWDSYVIDGTNDGQNGTPSLEGCPCFPDQPLLGADAEGIFISTNSFGPWPPSADTTFNGLGLYAISKSNLVAGKPTQVVAFRQTPLAEDLAYSVQPATSAKASAWDRGNGGTEYFLSSLDFLGAGDDRIAVWAMSNTKSLANKHPKVTFSSKVLTSEFYIGPPAAKQKRGGNTPLRDCLAADCLGLGETFDEPYLQLETNDDRMNGVVYAEGTLWAGLNTAVKSGYAEEERAGVAWFAVKPGTNNKGKVTGKVKDQGYLAAKDSDIMFPSFAVSASGKVVAGFSLSGRQFFPSSAYYVVGEKTIRVAGVGQDAEDGFTGYSAFAGEGVARWGDYSAAVAVGDTIFLANEWIPGGTRTAFANWGTFVTRLR